jgi:hypothetical protein
MTNLDPALLAEVLRHSLDGVAIVEDPGGSSPRVVYANATLAALLQQPEEWPSGRLLEEIEMEAPADPNGTSVGVGLRVPESTARADSARRSTSSRCCGATGRSASATAGRSP